VGPSTSADSCQNRQENSVSRTVKFTKFPDVWEHQLARIPRVDGAIYRVALYLLRESWRSDNPRVKLANGVMRGRGVGKRAKQRALRRLGRVGLISIEQHPRKSPIVTVKFTD
jgi:hypothetical protein